jgi:hypothetical protein
LRLRLDGLANGVSDTTVEDEEAREPERFAAAEPNRFETAEPGGFATGIRPRARARSM